jgi:hypothetical protein
MSEKSTQNIESNQSALTKGIQDSGLVDLKRLLEQLFPNPECRPSTRWGRTQVANRTIPFIRVGRLCFFSVAMVREHFHAAALNKVRAV